MNIIKKLIRIIIVLLYICYAASTIVHSNFWGDILSPIINLTFFIVITRTIFIKRSNWLIRLADILISLTILSWTIADILWAYCDLVLHIDPNNLSAITYFYALVNLFFALALTTYAMQISRKWNIAQMIVDSVAISYLTISLVWLVFFNQDTRIFYALKSDWISSVSIISDILIAIWVTIWIVSIRNGVVHRYNKLTVIAAYLYVITDMFYFYEYFHDTYIPNTFLDAVYVLSFGLLAIACELRQNENIEEMKFELFNTGRKNNGLYLLAAPLILIIFQPLSVVHLLQFVTVILLYYLVSSYIQNNIFKEGLLREEKENNFVLEQRVQERTSALEENNKMLQKLIDLDHNTGLYNRKFLLGFLDQEMASLKEDEAIVLLYIDINRYKMITTLFGDTFGENILFTLAQRLKLLESLAGNCILSSYRYDAFIFAAVGQYTYNDGITFAENALRMCSDTYQVGDYQIRVTVNIGISLYPFDALTKEDLIKHADVAMNQARRKGFNVIHEYDLKLSEEFFRKNMLELMLKNANYNKEFNIYYQPQINTEDKKMIGFEALLRWKTPSDEFVSPVEFIPIAEETGCIIPIGNWVISKVLKQLVEWNRRFDYEIMIGINVSLKQLNSAHFIEYLKQEINKFQVKTEWIDLEITESLQLQENPDVINKLIDIRDMGIKISIDDFGTGYSSLSYFKNLPVDRIKLAKELIDFVHKDDFDYQLAKSIIQLSKAKGIRVIAEGVETVEQWEKLKELGCDEVQGYLFGRPMPADVIEQIYKEDLFEAEE